MSKKLNYAKKYIMTNLATNSNFNSFTNGSFANGEKGWGYYNSTVNVEGASGDKHCTVLPSAVYGQIAKSFNAVRSEGDKIYAFATVKASGDNAEAILSHYINGVDYGSIMSGFTKNNEWVKTSSIVTAKDTAVSGSPHFNIAIYANLNVNFIPICVKNIVAVNLSQIFGQEIPTKTWLDNNVSYFENTTQIWKIDNEYYTDEQYKNMVNCEVSYA